ncbi:capsid cement protein [Nioella sp.]|uniref:capsid cement protein n=1 Tax=Nioella sp. TaxID=1912091 RepID=UPI003510EC66
MTTPLIKSYEASAEIAGHRIVVFSDPAASAKVAMAAVATTPAIGVSGPMDAVSGEMCDVVLGGLAQLKLGGTVTAGAPIMSDAAGAGIVAEAAASTTRRVIGFALEPGVSGDLIWVNVAPALLDRA